MYTHYQLAKAHQDELQRTAARDRLATQARRARPPGHTTRSPRRPCVWQPCACAGSFPDLPSCPIDQGRTS